MSRIVLDQKVNVAARSQFTANRGSEHGQFPDMMAPAERGHGIRIQYDHDAIVSAASRIGCRFQYVSERQPHSSGPKR